MTPYRMSAGVLHHCELCDGGNGVIIAVLTQTLVLKVSNCHRITTDTEKERNQLQFLVYYY